MITGLNESNTLTKHILCIYIYYYIIHISGGTMMNVDTDKKKKNVKKIMFGN